MYSKFHTIICMVLIIIIGYGNSSPLINANYHHYQPSNRENENRSLSSSQLSNTDTMQSKPALNTFEFGNFANFTEHAFEVRVVKFSPDGTLLASGSSDGSIRIWDITTGKTLHLLERHHYDVISLSFSPDGLTLVSGGFDMKINFWDMNSAELLDTWSIQPQVPYDIDFSPDGKTLAIGSGLWSTSPASDQNLRLFDIASGELIHNFQGHNQTVSSVSFTSDGKRLASGSYDKSIKIWNTTDGSELHSLEAHTDFVTSIVFSENSTTLLSGSFDSTVKIWDPDDGSLLKSISNKNEIWSVAYLNSENTIAASQGKSDYLPVPNRYWEFFGVKQESSVTIWDLVSEKMITELSGHNHIINSIDYSPRLDVLATGSWDWTVKLWGNQPQIDSNLQADVWETSTPEDEGLNSTFIEEKIDSISSSLHGVVIARNEKLIFERYIADNNHDYVATDKHVLYSATKSFTSALIGIAIDKGYIESVKIPILKIFSNYTFENVDDRKRAMTLQDVLIMRSGLQWVEGFPTDDLGKMAFNLNPLEYVLGKPMNSDPGTAYSYNTGGSQILSAVIKETTGLSTSEFAKKYLFQPIGIEDEDVVWMQDANGTAFGGIGLFLTPRNMAKFGQLFLNNGSWGNKQIISKDWVEISTQNHGSGYGYHWRISESLNGYYALGYNGKLIIVVPDKNMVISFTSSKYSSNLLAAAQAIVDSILPEVANDEDETILLSSMGIFSIVIFSIAVVVIILRKFKISKS